MIVCDICSKEFKTLRAMKAHKNGILNKGKKRSDEFKKIRSEKYTGEGNPNWRGGTRLIGSIHNRIRKLKPKPETCELCGSSIQIELSNKDHTYSDNPDDYRYLCNSCHQKYDYRNGLKEPSKKNIKKELKEAIINGLKGKEIAEKTGTCRDNISRKIREYWGEEGINNLTEARIRWLS